MTDSRPPYGGQPDPNAAHWGPPPGQPEGHPGFAPPGYPPPYGVPVPPPQKSNRGLMIGLGVGAAAVVLLALCGAGVGFLAFNGDDDDPVTTVATAGPPTGGGTGTTAGPAPTAPTAPTEPPPNNDAVTARYSSDLSSVCDGSPILNAANYTGPAGAKAYTFSNSVERPSSWSTRSTGYGKPYYAKSSDYTTVSVVGCLRVVQGSQGTPRKCDYKDSGGKTVTVDYISSRYTLTFHAAKTAEKIGDGGTVNAPSARCPSFVAYNRSTNQAYAAPDPGAIEAALDKFLA